MMSSSCLSGGGTIDLLHSTTRSPSSSSLTSSANSPLLSVSNRKPRTSTPRKRPNQTYYESAALLSAAFPNVFSSSLLLTHRPPPPPLRFSSESSLLIHHPSQDHKLLSFLRDSAPVPDDGEIQSKASAHLYDDCEEDFDAGSILDEELEEGIIDSIMGEKRGGQADKSEPGESGELNLGPAWGWGRRSPMELVGLGGRLGLWYNGIRTARGGSGWRDDVGGKLNWYNFLNVDANEISPKLKPLAKKSEKARRPADVPRNRSRSRMELGSPAGKKMLKLDYKNVVEAWAGRGRGSPFLDDTNTSTDVAGRVDKVMELIVEGMREESVRRYREKRKTRPFFTTAKKKTSPS